MNIVGVLFSGFTGVMALIVTGILEGSIKLFDDVLLSIENLDKFEFLMITNASFKGVAVALALLLSGYSAVKFFFAGFGVDSDPPAKILFRMVSSLFLVYGLTDFLFMFVKITALITAGIKAEKAKVQMSSFVEIFKSTIDEPQSQMVSLFIGLLVVVFLIIFYIKTYMRLIMCVMLLCFAPFAAASLALSSSAGIFQGYMKVFIGNLIVQAMQMLCIVWVSKILGGAEGGTMSFTFYLFSVAAILAIANKAEEITREMTISSGLASGGGLLSSAQSSLYAITGATRFLAK